MQRIFLEFAAAMGLTIAAILFSATGVNASDVMVSGAYARASATPMAKAGAAYVTLMNHGGEADRLVAISTPAASSAELHTTVMEGDVMKMDAMPSLDLPPGTTVEMTPGGIHVMMTGLKAPLKEGSKLEIILTFEKAGEIKVEVPVGGVAAGGHDHEAAGSGG